jgi:hypothetical protein
MGRLAELLRVVPAVVKLLLTRSPGAVFVLNANDNSLTMAVSPEMDGCFLRGGLEYAIHQVEEDGAIAICRCGEREGLHDPASDSKQAS